VTATRDRPSAELRLIARGPVQREAKGAWFLQLLHTTDHKIIARMYLVTALGFFLAAGLMAMLMRAELARPGMQFLSPEQYNQLFTEHGTIMLLLFATPIVFAFANFVLRCRSVRRTSPSRG
jgi:cytochrome c oxidase subunit I